ncbi:MAG: trypsin-like serine protease, partial [Alphaproteobacteria bacterium]|nr:trypsin-like serine protease [Alphaproteobacteria bacterium]
MFIRCLCVCTVSAWLAAPASAGPVLPEDGGAGVIHTIVVGDPNGSPAVTPDDFVDHNTTDSAFAGVVALRLNGSAVASGFAIGPRHIMTVAHAFDTDRDGTAEVAAGDTDVLFNFGTSTQHNGVASVTLHPDWSVDNDSATSTLVHDDVAIVELSSDIPAGMPTYALSPRQFEFPQTIHLAGYGQTGNGHDQPADLAEPNVFVKRVGTNYVTRQSAHVSDTINPPPDEQDDEGARERPELYLYDFDEDGGHDQLGEG